MQGGKVLRGFNASFGCEQNYIYRLVAKAVQPEFFDLVELLGLAESAVVLIVVVQTKQCKNLIDGVNQGRRVTFTAPSFGLRGLR